MDSGANGGTAPSIDGTHRLANDEQWIWDISCYARQMFVLSEWVFVISEHWRRYFFGVGNKVIICWRINKNPLQFVSWSEADPANATPAALIEVTTVTKQPWPGFAFTSRWRPPQVDPFGVIVNARLFGVTWSNSDRGQSSMPQRPHRSPRNVSPLNRHSQGFSQSNLQLLQSTFCLTRKRAVLVWAINIHKHLKDGLQKSLKILC